MVDNLQRGKLAFRQGKYEQAVHYFSISIERYRGKRQHQRLNWTVAAYMRLGMTKHALNEAQKIIKDWPRSSAGYLWLCQLHVSQRNYEAASSVAMQAFTQVSPKDHLFTDLQHMASVIRERRRDFIDILPTEVLRMIFKSLSFETLITCMDVCHQWKEFLVDAPDLFQFNVSRHVQFLSSDYTRQIQYLLAGGRALREMLILLDQDDNPQTELLMRVLTKNKYQKTKKLEIRSNFRNSSFKKAMLQDLLSACSLTTLSVIDIGFDVPDALEWILCNLQNLIHLTYLSRKDEKDLTQNISEKNGTNSLKLKSLDIRIRPGEIGVLSNLADRCFQLLFLRIDRNECGDLWPTSSKILETCPNLEYLHYYEEENSSFDFGEVLEELYDKKHKEDSNGVTYLHVENLEDDGLLSVNIGALEELSLAEEDILQWRRLDILEKASSLRSLAVFGKGLAADTDTVCNLSDLLKTTKDLPLETIQLGEIAPLTTDAIQYLPEHKQLEELFISAERLDFTASDMRDVVDNCEKLRHLHIDVENSNGEIDDSFEGIVFAVNSG